jgi:hypothetical protein
LGLCNKHLCHFPLHQQLDMGACTIANAMVHVIQALGPVTMMASQIYNEPL